MGLIDIVCNLFFTNHSSESSSFNQWINELINRWPAYSTIGFSTGYFKNWPGKNPDWLKRCIHVDYICVLGTFVCTQAYVGLWDEVWTECFFLFNLSFLLRKKQEDVTRMISKLQSFTLETILGCTLKVLHETNKLNKEIFMHLVWEFRLAGSCLDGHPGPMVSHLL